MDKHAVTRCNKRTGLHPFKQVVPSVPIPPLERDLFHLAHTVWTQDEANIHCSEPCNWASSSFVRSNMWRSVYEPSSKLSQKKRKSKSLPGKIANQDSLERQKSKFLLMSDLRSRSTNFKPILTESIQELTGIVDSQRMEIENTMPSRRDQLLLQEKLSERIRALRETRIGNLRELEELQKSHLLKVEELSRRTLTEDQNTIMEHRARIQELQHEVNCMKDSKDFKDAESVRSGPSHVPSQPAFLPRYRDQGELLSRNNQPPDIRNSQGISGNVFANPRASSSSPYPGGFNPWISSVTEDTPVLTSTGQPVTCDERHRFRNFTLTNSLLQQYV